MNKWVDESYKMLIDGKWVDSKNGKIVKVYDPANGEFLTTIPDATEEDVDAAVKAGWKAFDSWKNVGKIERAAMLNKIADLIDENLEKLAMIETLDNGKAIRENLSFDIPCSADHFRYFAGCLRAEEGTVTMLDNDTMSIILREPLGVVGCITPWNFPLLLACWKFAPALAAGNCIVLKPSSLTSLSTLEVAKLMQKILPPGVVNIITGRGSAAGQYLLDHPDVRKLAFTGSTEVGYKVADAAAKKIIPSTLELGGKSPNIVFPDCPWDKAIECVQMGILWNAGQVCAAGSRIFVHEDIYDKFVGELVQKFNNIKVGPSSDPDTIMGAITDESQFKKILNYIDIGVKEGAKIACGGVRATENGLDKGYFIKPTLLVNVNNKMRVAQEEIFGPVGVVIKFKDADEVIAMANDSEYGLAGGVWTKDLNTAFKVSRGVETGRMWVNTYTACPAHAPFGGYKKSGIGRETHAVMLDHYSQTKNIMISFPEGPGGVY